ncbi:MAG: type II toxin-antitoxin system PemK/MazF family toxin [Terriglobia bacterium]|jgi:mRNA interferase MazF
MKPRRGEVWWVRLDPTLGSEIKKTRPCVVVGTNALNEHRHTVVVVPLSTAPQAAPPVLVPVVCMGRRAVAVVDQIRAVAKERLTRHMGEISLGDLASVEEALRIVLEL